MEKAANHRRHPRPSFLYGTVICEDKDETGCFPGSSGACTGFSGGPAYSYDRNEFVGLCLRSREIDGNKETTIGGFVADLMHICCEAQYCRILLGRTIEDELYSVSFFLLC